MPEKTTDKTQRPSTKWETIFANDMTNKELISKIQTAHVPEDQKANNQIQKWAKF